MKSVQILSFSPAAQFLVQEGNKLVEASFEGLDFNNSLLTRQYTKELIGKTLECKVAKNGYKMRYPNPEFYEQVIRIGAATLNATEFEETKLFNPDEKIKLSTCQVDEEARKEKESKIVDHISNRRSLRNIFSKTKEIQVTLEYLAQDVVVSYCSEAITHFIPLKLRNIDHYFQLVSHLNLAQLIHSNKQISIKLEVCKLNLSKNQFEIQGTLPENVQRMILQEGWGTVSLSNIRLMNPQVFNQYRKLEQTAKNTHKGIFEKPFEILSLVYTKNNLVGTVEEIMEGYIFKVRSKNQEILKIELAKTYCPIGNESGAFACREFARKNLIGKEVNVFLTKDEGLNILGSLVRFSDNKDIETLMIENGYGFVKEELKGTMFYAKLEGLEKKAKELRKGIHNEKSISLNQCYEDFTAWYGKKQKVEKKNILEAKHNYLRLSQPNDEGVIEKCVDSTTYIVRMDAHKKLLRVKLDGVTKIIANPRLPEMIQLQKTSEKYTHRNFYQRTVGIELTEFNEQNNCFVGMLRHTEKGKEKLSFQQSILSQGLVVLSNEGFLESSWVECENEAKNKKINCWSDKLSRFVRNDIFDSQDKEFKGKFSWVEDGEIAYVQPTSANEQLDLVYELLSNKSDLKPIKQEDLVAGFLCGAPYLEEICRARIVSVDGNNVAVKFVDWGNKETVPLTSLREIPNQLQYIPSLCCEVELDMVRPLKIMEKEHTQRLRQFLTESQYRFIKSVGNTVNIYSGATHVNLVLIQEGYLKADLSKIPSQHTKDHVMQEMEKLRKELVGVWDIEDNASDLEDDCL